MLFIGDRPVVNLYGPHSPNEKLGQVVLKKGLHPIKVLYFGQSGGEALRIRYEDISKQLIPKSNLFYFEN